MADRPDLRTLVMEPWPEIPPEQLHGHANRMKPPLAVRDPAFLPPGLEWHTLDDAEDEGWYLIGKDQVSYLTDEQAEDMVLGRNVKRGYEICRDGDRWECMNDGEYLVTAPTPIEAWAACAHQVADAAKEQTNDD